MAAGTCIAKLDRWEKRWNKPQDKLQVVFEDGDTDKGDLMRAMKKYPRFEPTFLKKAQATAFQAADLLAYEHLLVNVKIAKARPALVLENELRYPLKALADISYSIGATLRGANRGADRASKAETSARKK